MKILGTKQCPHCYKLCRVTYEPRIDTVDIVKLPQEGEKQ